MTMEELENRLRTMEKKIEVLEEEWHNVCISTAEFKVEIKQLTDQITDMKLEITKLLTEQLNKQWKLIIGLVGAIIILVGGTKLAPDLLKALI
jgi:hypothetical protein